MTTALPHCRPYNAMMTFFSPGHVDLVIMESLLQQLTEQSATLIDVLADERGQTAGGAWWFHYTSREWCRLCGALGEIVAVPIECPKCDPPNAVGMCQRPDDCAGLKGGAD